MPLGNRSLKLWFSVLVFYALIVSLVHHFDESAESISFWRQVDQETFEAYLHDASVKSFPKLGPGISIVNLTVPSLHPLRHIDREFFTLRINSWRRPLKELVTYYAACPGVAEIQVVWCDSETEPPGWLMSLQNTSSAENATNFLMRPTVLLDRREINSLHERYNLSKSPPTLGIMSVDDDILIPCITLDHVFFLWTCNPERLVALQPRMHDGKSFAYYGWARREYNVESVADAYYTMALPTLGGMVHRDYMDWYMQYLPRHLFQRIDSVFNCEDLALHFWIVALTRAQPALLGHYWAMQSMTQLSTKASYNSSMSSRGARHYATRSQCVKELIHGLGLDTVPYEQLRAPFLYSKTRSMRDIHSHYFDIGVGGRSCQAIVARHARLEEIIQTWMSSPQVFHDDTRRQSDGRSNLFHKLYA
jgi:hypothetical protein